MFFCGKLVTRRYGLAVKRHSSASPYCLYGQRVAVSARKRPRAAAGRFAEYSEPSARRSPKDLVGRPRVAARRSDSDQQLVAQQNGKRNPKAARERRSVHNAGVINWTCHGGNRMLVIGQLLVAGSGRSRRHSGLTNGQSFEPE